MVYSITKTIAGIKVVPAVHLDECREIEAKFGDRLTNLGHHSTRKAPPIASRYSFWENLTMLSMAEGTATDSDVETVRQILQKHENGIEVPS